jgi:predicted LPLAT superfamily acyltransferase
LNNPHWAHINEVSFILGMKFLFWVYRIGGRTPFRIMLYPVVFIYFVIQPAARRASKNYLAHIKQPNTLRNNFKHFISFAESILDKLLLWGNLFPLSTVQNIGRECVTENIAQKKGGLLLCSHLGNLELCRVISQVTDGVKITVLMHTKHAQNFNHLLAKLNPNSQLNVVQVTEMTPYTAIDLMDKIKLGEFVVIAADRIPVSLNSRTVKAPFLGETADFPIGPYVLAHLLQCPVYLIFSLRTPTGADLYFELFREKIQLPRKNRDEAYAPLAADYAARLAYYCQKAPYQWFNFYDFWK